MDALELFRAGKLREAVAACIQQVQNQPTKPDARDLLAQLLCFLGDWERADKHLDVLSTQFPDRGVAVATIRQLIRAAGARQQFFEEGRLPEFVTSPPEYLQRHLEASICLRGGDAAEAARLLAQAEEARPRRSGRCGDAAFSDLRDADDLTSSFFEAFTSNGKYYWLPFERVRRITLFRVESPLDVLWRRCQIEVQDGPNGVVYLPQLYVDSAKAEDELLRVGQSTEWRGADGEPVRGVGHRILWIDNDVRPLVNIDSITFDVLAAA
jgi:type VI secretion system protein ImpE